VSRPPGIIHILVPREAAVRRLSQQVGEGRARILGAGGRQVFIDESAQAEAFVELPDQNRTSVGNDPEPRKIHVPQVFEREMKGLILYARHGGWTTGAASAHSNPHHCE
jgi:hypothetical protein